MARIDPLIESLLCEKGTELRFETGQGAVLSLPSGPITPIARALSSQQIRAAMGELAPPDMARSVAEGTGVVTFSYRHAKGTVLVRLEPEGERLVARVVPQVLGVPAVAPPAMPPPAPAPGPAAAPAPPSAPAPQRRDESRKKKKARRAEPEPERDEEEDAVEVEVDVESEPRSVIVLAPTASMLPATGAARTHSSAVLFDRLLDEMIDCNASDVHLSTGHVPSFRIDGDMAPAPGWEPLALDELTAMLYSILPSRNRKEFEAKSDTDCAWENPKSRFRVNVFMERHGIGSVIRAIPNKIRTVEEMGLSKHILDLCRLPKGLVLVTGPTGSGKSTTLAGMIDYINRTRSDHIITIEDPIEFVHPHKKCVVHQREVAVHTESFKKALRAALREDPDIVLVGEMRDLETVAIAIETAETGHLVFGTLHTNTAPSSVDRIIDQFSADRQAQIRTMLAETLKAVITQTLCKKIGGGRIPAMEVLMVNPAVSNLIREGKTFQIPSMMQTGRGIGMITQADALLELVRARKVDPQEAYYKAVAKGEMKQLLERAGYRVE